MKEGYCMKAFAEKFTLPVKYTSLTPINRKLVREQYVLQQKGMCYWCGSCLKSEPPNSITSKPINRSLFPKGFFQHPVHLQHCHNTGWTEGAVHAYCNAIMWQYHRR